MPTTPKYRQKKNEKARTASQEMAELIRTTLEQASELSEASETGQASEFEGFTNASPTFPYKSTGVEFYVDDALQIWEYQIIIFAREKRDAP